MKLEPINMIATCPNELRDVVAEEIQALPGWIQNVATGYRSVTFETDERGFYEAHLRLRTVSRLAWILKDVPAGQPEILFDKARRIQWPNYFSAETPIRINAIAGDGKNTLMPTDIIGSKIREALNDCFQYKVGKTPNPNSVNAVLAITAFLRGKRCTISLDTSGMALHKRGYRVSGHTAPIKETLAASLLHLVGYTGEQNFLDPTAGSGTIAIEAAQIALKKAALIHRAKDQFGFEHMRPFNRELWRVVQDDARKEQIDAPPSLIMANDIDSEMVSLAKESAMKARVEKHMKFRVGDFFQLPAPAETGILVANLPYGERLEIGKSESFYKEIGDHLKQNYKGWRVGLLVSQESPYKNIHLKPSRQFPLKNGALPVKFLIYDMY